MKLKKDGKLNENVARKVKLAKKLLTNNYRSGYTIPILASRVEINERALKDGFKIMYNTTIFEYLTQQRMEHAKELLAENGRSILEIAQRVGYKNNSVFTQAFRRRYKLAPKQWQKLNSKECTVA